MRIPRVHLDADSQGLFLELNCPNATGYVLCFSIGAPVEVSQLQLTENDLRNLYNGRSLQMDSFRLQGVPRRVFHAMAVYRKFEVVPPEQIQVWAMSYAPFDDIVTLHVPEKSTDQLCYAPLRYTFHVRMDGEINYLTVKLLDHGKYDNGALAYQVGDSLPIPIPASAFGREIPVKTGVQKRLNVVVVPEYVGKYQLDKKG